MKNNPPKICIITPEIVGPVKNGGIGTHAFYLSKLLSLNYQVTVLFTGKITQKNLDFWKDYYQNNWKINFFDTSELPPNRGKNYAGNLWFINRSLSIYNWLKTQNFQICHFQDWQGNGFISIQAKRTGQAFENTLLACTTHSSCQWIREVSHNFPDSKEDLILDYVERYCLEFADFVISPSEYMFRWTTEKGWKITQKKQVIPLLLEIEKTSLKKNDEHHIIFFGRLEKRKGIKIFLEALKILEPRLKEKNTERKITFLGKLAKVDSQEADQLVKETFANLSDIYSYVLLNNYGHLEAINFLKENAGALIVIPSIIDNFPYAALECIELGLNIIASNTGGIPEMFADDERLFQPTPESLAEKLKECLFTEIKPLKKRYSSQLARELWQEFHVSYFENLEKFLGVNNKKNKINNPLVSVCINSFNKPEYINKLLQSIEEQTYPNFEVIIVSDRHLEKNCKSLDKRHNLQLLESIDNIGKARNLAAQKANGEYLFFIDADSFAEPEAIEKMVKGIQSGVDCLTCYGRNLKDDVNFTPIGACLEAGIYQNVFGISNFIINKQVLLELNGFNENSNKDIIDWEFFASLVLAGYSLDVIPEYLFLQEYPVNNYSTTDFERRSRVLAPYLNNMPWWQQRFIINAIGNSHQFQPLNSQEVGIPKPIFSLLRSIYLKLSGGGLENQSPNFFAKFLNSIALKITENARK